MSGCRQSEWERECVYAQCGCGTIATSGDSGAPDPTIAFPCARRFTDTSSRVVYSNQLALHHGAPRLWCVQPVLGTASLHLHLGCLVQMFFLWARAGFGSPGCRAQPLCSTMPQNAVPCRLSPSTITQSSQTDWVTPTCMVPVVLGWAKIYLLGSLGVSCITSEHQWILFLSLGPSGEGHQAGGLPGSCSQWGHLHRAMLATFGG